ncbi:MAG: peptidase [Rariglobus sp.]|jgi:Zn-dependent protease|nr:peptidase [Rariglobus sp.]
MLGWSMNLFRIRGIQLSVHVSFLLLLAYVAWEGWTAAAWRGAVWMICGVSLMFVCVTLHELGHAAAARWFGIRVPRILLLPIGGMAEMDEIPRRPRDEIIIALAGPAVNYLIIGALMIFVRFPQGMEHLRYLELTPAGLGRYLVLANVIMGVFNLLPAFPMDGGRVLRALLAMRTSYLRATQIAAGVGKVLALAGAVCFLFYHYYHGAVLFAFIIFAGEQELRAVARMETSVRYWHSIRARFSPPIDVTPVESPRPRII